MSGINPRTFPIALVLAGAIVISIAIYAYAFGQHVDFFLTIILVVIGLCAFLLAIPIYVWEKNKYYEDKKEIHL